MTTTTEIIAAKKNLRNRRIALLISVAGAITMMILTLTKTGPFDENDTSMEWVRFVLYAVIFLPYLHLIVGRPFQTGESIDALAAKDNGLDRNGNPRKGFTFTSNTATTIPSDRSYLIPVAVVVVLLMAFCLGGGWAITALMDAGLSLESFTGVMIGYGTVTLGALAWLGYAFSAKQKALSKFQKESTAGLDHNGYTWAKKDFPICPGNVYTRESPAVLLGNDGIYSRWSIEWNGSTATVTPVPKA